MSLKTIRTVRQLKRLPADVRLALLDPKYPGHDERFCVHYIFRHSVVFEGVEYQLDWAALAKQLAPELHVRGEPGGWIYPLVKEGSWKGTLNGNRPYCQGWVAYAKRWYPSIAAAARRACGAPA